MRQQRTKTRLLIAVYIILALLDFVPIPLPARMVFPLFWLTVCALYMKRWMLSAALFFSFMGDVMGWQNELIPQIAFFALTQILYIILFTFQMPPEPARPKSFRLISLAILMTVYAAAVMWIFPKVEDSIIAWGIAVYAVLLLGMCYSALQHRDALLMLGATFFVVSDFILGTHLFVQHIPYSHYLIMVPYYLGQGLLFAGIIKPPAEAIPASALDI